jgi:hypothetical protein
MVSDIADHIARDGAEIFRQLDRAERAVAELRSPGQGR